MRVRYALAARAFILSEQGYLAERSDAAALRFRARLWDAEQRIAQFPEIGTIGRVRATRRFVVAPYVVTYRIRPEEIEIVAIRHGQQRDSAEDS
jgi:toxin ParE1/3/4